MQITARFRTAERVIAACVLAMAAILCQPVAATSGQPRAQIPSLQAEVTKLQFYESGKGFPPRKDRIYRTEFFKSKARFIDWELNLKHPAPGRRINFKIRAKYYKPGGELLMDQVKKTYLQPNWTTSGHTFGCGNSKTGTWEPGRYRVDLFIEGRKVASGGFKVLAGKGGGGGGKTPPAKPDIPDDLGEL